ncbi:MAG: hypothetical protein JSV86_21430 [Gemmatimonadota bacterium]|nr:MAG: hypothetical protein JSV86_21430 [Gemmatimonadota bacterium]
MFKKNKAKKDKPKTKKSKLFRVIFRGHEYLGTAEQFHAKVVAADFATALQRACSALGLDPTKVDGAAITLIADETELADGKVFDFARRSRAFGERGGWVCKDVLPRKEPTGPRKTEAL